jgi:hypothetical protein
MRATHRVCWRNCGQRRYAFVAGALLCLCLGQFSLAQVSVGGTPPSFTLRLGGVVPNIVLPAPDHAALLAEDEQEPPFALVDENDVSVPGVAPIAPRFAVAQDVALNPHNSGAWQTLPDGTRIWRLRIVSPGAYSLHLLYDQFRLPKHAELFLYDDHHDQVRGAFTSANNWKDGTNITGPVAGDAITLEYVIRGGSDPAQPLARDNGELEVSQVCHAYRNLFGPHDRALDMYGDSGPCQVNINCPLAAAFADEKRAVAMVISGGSRWCSGTLINNARQDGIPYFLTADHCLNGNQSNWLFIFNYESPGCTNQDGPLDQSVANATLRAHYPIAPGTDFALLELSAPVPAAYNPYYCGWDRLDQTVTGVSGISHPAGDVKKFASDSGTTGSSGWTGNPPGTHWHCNYDFGGMEVGSSGSPLLDQSGHVLGQLTGGYLACGIPDDSWYGKLARSWDGGGDSTNRLRDWLDPDSSGTTSMNGMNSPAIAADSCPAFVIPGLPFTATGTTSFATDNFYGSCVGSAAPDVIYQWVAMDAQNVTVTLCGSSYDTGLYVRRSVPCPGAYLIRCNDDGCGTPGSLTSTATFFAIPGETYFFIVDGDAGNRGMYTLAADVGGCPPAQLVIRPSGTDIQLAWDVPVGCLWSGFHIYRSVSPDVPMADSTLIGTTSQFTYTDINVLAGSHARYYYAVTNGLQ